MNMAPSLTCLHHLSTDESALRAENNNIQHGGSLVGMKSNGNADGRLEGVNRSIPTDQLRRNRLLLLSLRLT
jgi:hypothetical protein